MKSYSLRCKNTFCFQCMRTNPLSVHERSASLVTITAINFCNDE